MCKAWVLGRSSTRSPDATYQRLGSQRHRWRIHPRRRRVQRHRRFRHGNLCNAPAASRVDEILMKEVPLEDFESFTIRYSTKPRPRQRRSCLPTWQPATNAPPSCSTLQPVAITIPSLTARTAARASPSSTSCLTTANTRPWRHSPCASNARPNTPTRKTAAFTPNPTPASSAAPISSGARSTTTPMHKKTSSASRPKSPPCAKNGTVKEGRIAPFGVSLKASDAIIDAAVRILRVGGIVAIKGAGRLPIFGLRRAQPRGPGHARTQTPRHQAAGCHVSTLDALREDCLVSNAEERLLTGAQRPIVLLKKRVEAHFAEGLADGLSELGAMLPRTRPCSTCCLRPSADLWS